MLEKICELLNVKTANMLIREIYSDNVYVLESNIAKLSDSELRSVAKKIIDSKFNMSLAWYKELVYFDSLNHWQKIFYIKNQFSMM